MAMNPMTRLIVVNTNGIGSLDTIAITPAGAIACALTNLARCGSRIEWPRLQEQGYRVVKVEIVEKVDER